MRFLSVRPGELFRAGGNGIFVREEGQSGWTDLSEGLPSRNIRAMAVEGDRLAAGSDNGQTWLRELEPVPTPVLIRAPARSVRPQARYRAFRGGESAWRRADGRVLPEPGREPIVPQ